MKQYVKLLGKVTVTLNGDWNETKEYERLCIVRNPINKKTYMSKMFVPAGKQLTDETYWQYIIGGIEDNLLSTDPEQALSANMGRVLSEMINNAIADYNNKIVALTNKHNTDIKSLTDKHNSDIQSLTTKHNNDVDTLNTAISNAIKDYNSKINALTTKHNQEINNLTNKHNQEIASLQSAIATLNNTVAANKAQHDSDIDALTDVVDELSKQHSEDIAQLQTLVNNITSFEVEVVTTLPTTGTKGVIYLVKSSGTTTDKAIYTEYIWIPSTSKYEILGEFETAVDLGNYQEKLVSGSNIKTINGVSLLGSGNINTTPSIATTTAAGLMSADDKSKLNNIASGAEVNVQSDWNETGTNSDAYIKNKPGVASGSANGLMSSNDKSKLDNIASGATKVAFTAAYTSGTKIGTININGSNIDIYIPIWNGTLAQYNAIANKQSDMIYNITD